MSLGASEGASSGRANWLEGKQFKALGKFRAAKFSYTNVFRPRMLRAVNGVDTTTQASRLSPSSKDSPRTLNDDIQVQLV